MKHHPPQTISWNLTRLCNLQCSHCYLDASTRAGVRRDELDTGQCLAVIDQIHSANPDALVILTGGEPLLRKDLEHLIRAASAKGLWTVLGTNGTLLSRERAENLQSAGLKGIGISLDGLKKGQHDAFRGKPGAWDGAVAGVEAAVKANIDVVMQVTVNPWVVDDLEGLVRFSIDKGARAVNFYFLVCTGRGQEHGNLPQEKAEKVYARLYDLQTRYRGEVLINAKCAPQFQRFVYQQDPDSSQLHAFPGGCPAGTFYCRIDPKGEVTPCPFIPTSGGSLAEQSLQSIWEDTELFQQLRRREALQGRCGRCEFRQVCGGCRARGYAEFENVMAEDPFCLHQPGTEPGPVVEVPETALYQKDSTVATGISWESEAENVLQKIPPFVRGMVRRRMETFAQKNGGKVVTLAMLQDIRKKMGTRMDLASPVNRISRD